MVLFICIFICICLQIYEYICSNINIKRHIYIYTCMYTYACRGIYVADYNSVQSYICMYAFKYKCVYMHLDMPNIYAYNTYTGMAIIALQKDLKINIHLNRITMKLELDSSLNSKPEVYMYKHTYMYVCI
jgi:hypothetical protein